MTIRKRILRSTKLIVFLSLITLLVIGGVVIKFFEDAYITTLIPNAKLQENAYDVQLLFNEFVFNDEVLQNNDFESLAEQLEVYNYQLYVSDDNRVVFSNISGKQYDEARRMEKSSLESEKTVIYLWEDNTVIGKKLINSFNEYNIIALNENDKISFTQLSRNTYSSLLLSFFIVGFFAVLFIVFFSQIYTGKLVNHIMIPIQKIMKAYSRVEKGNLNEPIEYIGIREFETVCLSFNEMQEILKQGIEKNKAHEKARIDMITEISHDLRTPLTSVQGYIKGVLDGITNTPEKQKLYLETAYKKACDMDILLQKLFDISKLETGDLPLNLLKTDLNIFLKNYINLNKEYFNQKNIEVVFNTDDNEHFVLIDKEHILRVINNIIENSIKYKKKEELKITINLIQDEKEEKLSISDNGSGVSEEKLGHLFERFYRVDESRNSKIEGSGLGLYISRYIIEKHGGKIAAKNNEGLCIEMIFPRMM